MFGVQSRRVLSNLYEKTYLTSWTSVLELGYIENAYR